MKKFLFLALAMSAVLTSCQKGEQSQETQSGEVTFKTEIVTKVAGGVFETGDEISVVALENGAVGSDAVYSYANGSFTSTEAIELEEGQPLGYVGIYPKTADNTTEFDFAISTDQSVAENYELSDLLVANADATLSLQPTLAFNHVLSQIVVNVEVDGALTDISTAAIELNAKTAVECDALNNVYTASGEIAKITPALNGANGFLALIAPQAIDAEATIATLTLNGEVYTWSRSTEQIFLSGKRYVFNWAINTATGESTVTIDAQINDWNQGETNPGEPDEPDVPVVAGDPFVFSGLEIIDALGKTTDDFVNQRIFVEDCEFENGLVVNGAQGSHKTLAPCVWDGTSYKKDVRIYGGNTITFSSKDKKILSITFVSTHNYMTGPEGYTKPASSYDSSTWNGVANEVTFSTSEASYIDSFSVTLEAE